MKLNSQTLTCPKAVILTALREEFLAVRSHLQNIRYEPHPHTGTAYEIGYFVCPGNIWEICLVEAGKGNPNAASETERAIGYFKPRVALLVGIAGGIKDVKLGDVVAGEKVHYYESGKVEDDGFKWRPAEELSTYAITQAAKKEARSKRWLLRLTKAPKRPRAFRKGTPKAFVEPIAAGEKVVAGIRSKLYKDIRKNCNDAYAVEMEGKGFLSSTRAYSQMESLVVRGISDLIAQKAIADAKDSHEWASHTASAFAFEVLSKFIPPSRWPSDEKVISLPTRPYQIQLPKSLPKQICVWTP